MKTIAFVSWQIVDDDDISGCTGDQHRFGSHIKWVAKAITPDMMPQPKL